MKNRKSLARKFDRQAKIYRRQNQNNRFAPYRRKLLEGISGNVLELAVGAGANFAHYTKDVHVTAVDISGKMLEAAEQEAVSTGIQANFIQSDIEKLEFPENSFDAVVSTLSFCGYEDPLRLFNKLGYWCKSQGDIRLLEHGISDRRMLAIGQKLLNPLQHKIVGCHLDRDILGLLEASDLTIDQTESFWQGMFHIIWARPGT